MRYTGFRIDRPVLIAAALLLPALMSGDVRPEEPVTSKLEERLETQLVQLDVTIDGKPEVVGSLRDSDFSLTVGGHDIESFTVDRLCDTSVPAGGEADSGAGTPPGAQAPSFLFFFDQPHLTTSGRMNALDLARDLIIQLVERGARAAIVSSAAKLGTVVPLTGDRARLLQGLDRLRSDLTQWDRYAATEDNRIQEIIDLLKLPDVEGARHQARAFADDEWRQARQSEERLGLSVRLLERQRPPRGAFYFGDTLRQDAGQHYLRMVPRDPGAHGDIAPGLDAASAFDFDRVIRDALGVGVHLFPVQAEGMAPDDGRVASAENSLISLGLETGGEAFIRGVPASKISARVRQRFGCMYLLSFKPAGLPTDEMLSVAVTVARKGVKAHAQGLIVIPSASARRASRLLAAFTQGDTDEPGAPFTVSTIFLSVEKDRYRALVQLRAPPTGTPNGAWELGASLVSRGAVRDDFSAHVGSSAPNAPIVLEKEVTLEPGPYEIVAVGQASGDRYLSSRLEGVLPAPSGGRWVSPIAAVQEGAAAFSRNAITRTSGSLVLSDGEPVDPRKPVALISVVWREGPSDQALVERKLTGTDTVSFDPIRFAAAERCVQVRDVIPAKILGPGTFTYALELKRGEVVLQTANRQLVVAESPEVNGRDPKATPGTPPPPR